ncbi:MAG: hypothetical protein ABJF01_19700 [bacterium]
MPTQRKKSHRRRSTAVPLSIVPALAALVATTGCARSDRLAYDPCESASYVQTACDSAVVHHGYWYGGTWYPHTYQYLPLYYFGRYNSYVSGGGRVRSISPTVYSPSVATPSRPNVVRGGFGGIGEGHGAAGS